MVKHNEHYVKFDAKDYNKCEEIRSYSNDELLMEFKSIVEPLYTNKNLHMFVSKEPNTKAFTTCKTELHPDNNWFILSITSMRGHKDTSDFYTIISNNLKELNKREGTYKDISKIVINTDDKQGHYFTKKVLEYYFAFDTEVELNNFINYLKTDFVRICLYLIKTTMHLDNGELKYIPWFDFSDPVFSKSPTEIDDYLFAKYNISNEIRKHIEELLPDYYSIRNKN